MYSHSDVARQVRVYTYRWTVIGKQKAKGQPNEWGPQSDTVPCDGHMRWWWWWRAHCETKRKKNELERYAYARVRWKNVQINMRPVNFINHSWCKMMTFM